MSPSRSARALVLTIPLLALAAPAAGEREVRYGVELLRSGMPVSSQSGTVKLGG